MLVCPDWEDKYPLALVYALEREISDHNPLILDTGDHKNSPPIFRFENSWMVMEGFREFVVKNWNVPYMGSSLDMWQQKMRHIRKKIRGWVLNANVAYRKKKKELLDQLNELDKNAKKIGLCAHDRDLQKK